MRLLTLNLRLDLDRWAERLPLVVALLVEADADVVALQEVALPIAQDRMLAGLLREVAPAYVVHTAPKWDERQVEAISLLTRLPARDHEVLELPGAGGRVAQRVVVRLPGVSGVPGGMEVTVVNTHLHHEPYDDESVREPQARALLSWLGDTTTSVLAGDLNAGPGTATLDVLRATLSSALPDGAVTFPTPLSTEGLPPMQLDHVLVGRGLRVTSAAVVGDAAALEDPGLAPSDHAGVLATIEPAP